MSIYTSSRVADLTHRRNTPNLSSGWVILFSEDEERNSHYGDHVWTLHTELPKVEDAKDLIRWAADYYECSIEEGLNFVNPDNIVDTARAWDDPQFVSDLWQAMEQGEVRMVPGYRTYDGAIVLDRESVEMTYEFDNEGLE